MFFQIQPKSPRFEVLQDNQVLFLLKFERGDAIMQWDAMESIKNQKIFVKKITMNLYSEQKMNFIIIVITW